MKARTMRRSHLPMLFGFALLLAACGGGGGMPSTGGGPTPTPIPTATPTPMPTGVVPGPGTALSGLTTYNGGWTPYGVASGLDFPVQHGWNGTGETVGIVIDSDVDRTVVNHYLTQFGITETGTITTISVDGSHGIPSPGGAAGDQDEAYLDVETVAGLAPGANILVYQINDLNDTSIAKAYSKIESDGIATVVNSSFGGCEYSGPPEDPFLQQGAQAGILFVASGGDNGNVCNPPSTVGANYPASNPYVIGAGGSETSLSLGHPITSTTLWNDDTCTGSPSQCAGGGGVSAFYTLPAYQSGVAGMFSTRFRNVPDVSMPAESDNLYDGSWVHINGTSWAAPEYAALMAELYQYCHLPSGLANPVSIPYYVDQQNPQAYIDIVSGIDQYQGTTPYYRAGPGYDDASGFGVPIGMTFANTACPGGVKAGGLLMHTAMSNIAATQQRSAQGFTLDVTPRVSGLTDLGARSASAPTSVQVVLRPGANRAAVETALQNAGFTIDRRFTYNGLVDASAPSATLEQTFRTRIHDVSQEGFGTRYLPTTQIVVPASLAPYVDTVTLDDVISRHVL